MKMDEKKMNQTKSDGEKCNKMKCNRMKMKRLEWRRERQGLKALMGSMIRAGGLFLSACGAQAKGVAGGGMLSAEETTECVMESMKELDLEQFNMCTDNYVQTEYNWMGVPVRSEYRIFNELLQPGVKFGKVKEKYEFHHELYEKMLENLTWEIKSVEQDGDQAKISMVITNIDMNGVMGEYEMRIWENMIASEGSGFLQMIEDFSQMFDEDNGLLAIMNDYDQDATCTFEVTATAFRENGVWILHLDEELINACLGNMNAEEYSEEMQQKIRELEKIEDEKLDEWADEFSRDVEKWVDSLFGE